MKLTALTSLALIAFAANSLLCRWALGERQIDAASFTTVRLTSGALALLLIQTLRRNSADAQNQRSHWLNGGLLFSYAICFSLAYVSLGAGLGALLLFGAVQVTMMTAAWRSGERLTQSAFAGFAVASAGLVYLLRPGASAPPLAGACLMIASGISWGIYSVAGKAATDPINQTARNFRVAVLPSIAVSLVAFASVKITATGAAYASLSGAVTSGCGYVLWYTVLPSLSGTQAAILQLLVPVIAAAAGITLLGEPLSERLVISTLMIAAGVSLTVLSRTGQSKQPE